LILDKVTDSDKKKFIEEYEFQFKKGQAMYYSELSLKRPLTDSELTRFRQLCKEIGIQV
jgi:hypothetical protein